MIVTFGGWALALLVALVGAAVQWRKGSVDESALVLGKWKELVDTHQRQIGQLQSRIDALTTENTDLRARLGATETEFADYRRATDGRIRAQDEEIAGLKRRFLQNSGSTVLRIDKSRDEQP
jgi:predicted RNase H-like nuclease (RuvC/YqgF family)